MNLRGVAFYLLALCLIAQPSLSMAKIKPIEPRADQFVSAQDIQKYEKELCGEPPASPEEKKAQAENLKAVESQMPPIQEQGPTNWCAAFSTADLLNYFVHSKSHEPYSDGNKVAVLDLIADGQKYLLPAATSIGPDQGYYPLALLIGAQEESARDEPGGLRSLAGMTAEQDDPHAKSIVEALFTAYSDDHTIISASGSVCRPSITRDSRFASWLETVMHVNGGLSRGFDEKSRPDLFSIDEYQAFCERSDQETKAKKIHIPPFTANQFQTSDLHGYLSKLRGLLQEKTPASISICGNDIDPLNTAASVHTGDHCGGHMMTAVGAAWVDGACKIRLRNSWGKDWGTDSPPAGYIDLTVSQLLRATGDLMGGQAEMTWISESDSGHSKQRIEYDSTQGLVSFDGASRIAGNDYHENLYMNGRMTTQQGTIEYKDSIATMRDYDLFSNGSRFTGTTDASYSPLDGTLTSTDGSTTRYEKGNAVKPR